MEEFLNHLSERIAIMPFLLGIVFTSIALIMVKFPPKKINQLYGYRTPRSMKNQESWDFTQQYSSIKMIKGGLFLFFFSFLKIVIPFSESVELILGFGSLLLVIIYFIVSTEKAIKKKFPNQ
jgi:uncharacterized membrane protein